MDLPDAVQQFILKYINSVDQLEILLLLKENPQREWTPAEVAQTLRTNPNSAASRMEELAANHLLSEKKADDKTLYRYHPRSPEMGAAVDMLAQAHPTYRVSIITLIYSKPNDKIRTFADAFRLKKEENE